MLLFFETKVHYRLTGVHIQNCHRHGCRVDVVKHQDHHTVAYLELEEVFVPQNIAHLIGVEVPYSVALVSAMFCDNFHIQIVNLHEVRILESEVIKECFALAVTSAQVFKRYTPALHLGEVVVTRDCHDKY